MINEINRNFASIDESITTLHAILLTLVQALLDKEVFTPLEILEIFNQQYENCQEKKDLQWLERTLGK